MKAKYIIGVIIIVAFAGWGISSFISTTIKYVSLAEVASTEGTVQVIGKIDFDAVRYDTDNSRLIFEITDLNDNTGHRRLKIIYSGMVPGNFEQATSVVAKGHYDGSAFIAEQLLVKCPSKYQGQDGDA